MNPFTISTRLRKSKSMMMKVILSAKLRGQTKHHNKLAIITLSNSRHWTNIGRKSLSRKVAIGQSVLIDKDMT